MATRKLAPEHFEFETAYTPAVYNEQGGMRTFTASEVQNMFNEKELKIRPNLPEVLVPVGLRWRLKPALGLPVTPFNVWRKAKKSDLPSTAISFGNFPAGIFFLNGPFFD